MTEQTITTFRDKDKGRKYIVLDDGKYFCDVYLPLHREETVLVDQHGNRYLIREDKECQNGPS